MTIQELQKMFPKKHKTLGEFIFESSNKRLSIEIKTTAANKATVNVFKGE